ncbi:hypothetical protein D9756_004720 [Leucocoprinus leucothites]|uniref:NudC domain-containing protein 1 n=1 Tax=Leucocoprinus leucothites TaxID=201217 RepID=A0A8H5LKF9_9AGAR|nr:hypothetical protein D9756_004720 [Leucoagaricus leucothites]
MDGDFFHPDKALLNPKFEGYKLHILPQENAVLQFPLTNRPTQAATSGKAPLSFQEVQSRITHNHLAIHSESGRGVYVDADYNVILVDLGQDRLSPSMRIIFEFPKPLQSEAIRTEVHREYPSASFITSTSLLTSDGQGTIYVLALPDSSQTGHATLVGSFVLPSTGSESVDSPFRIHHVHQPSPLHVIATLSSRLYPSNPPVSTSGRHHNPVEFDVWGVKISLLDVHADDTPARMEILWHRRGEEVPMYVAFVESYGLHLLLGGSDYRKLDTPPLPTYEPTPDEIAPIPRADELSVPSNLPQRPPPYSWTQTSDSVTVAIPLPSTTPKERIRVLFSPTTLTCHVDLDPSLPMPLGAVLPRYSAKKLWDDISPSSSFWTFDRQAERSYGILSLHIEKQNEDTRWSHVFASAGTDSAADEDIDVPETLDPSELWNIREALEKYTAALQGEDISGLGLGQGVPSLAENELDEEVDSSVGRKAFITWVSDPTRQGQQPEFLSPQQSPFPFQLLSTPIPGHTSDLTSLIVKSNIDGTVFELGGDISGSSQPPQWKHTATFPALAFVLASKRDTRFTHHIPGQCVFAFESGSNNRGGNVYIYYPAGPKALTAKQSILKINDGRGGALMGIGSFTDNHGKAVIACLTEGELTLIRGL